MKLCEHGWTWWISTHLGDTMCFTMIVLTLFWFCLDHGDMFSCSLFLRTWQELVTTVLSFLEIQNPEKILNLSVYLLSLKTMDFDVKHLKLQKLLVFGMAIGCPGCFLKVWGLSWAKWKLPLKTLDITRKNPAKLPQISANPKMAESEHFQILGVWGWPHLAVSHCQMTWNTWNSWNHWKAETPDFFHENESPGCLELMP